jgi:hypothetical protein
VAPLDGRSQHSARDPGGGLAGQSRQRRRHADVNPGAVGEDAGRRDGQGIFEQGQDLRMEEGFASGEVDLLDTKRGRGAWRNAVRAIQLLAARGILPIVTATEILSGHGDSPGTGTYQRFRDFLLSLGIEKARVKILPVFPAGRLASTRNVRLIEADLDGFDRSRLQCADARVVAADGVYACPILAGLPGAKLSGGSRVESFRSASLYHPACVTCYETGMSCRT